MDRYARLAMLLLAAAIGPMAGCTSKTTTVSNPFTTADRVPPPALRTVPGAAPAYYPEAPTTAPAFNAAPAYGAAPPAAPSPYTNASPYGAPAYGAPPSTAPSTFSPAAPGQAPAPGTATPYYGASASRGAAAPGDSIAVLPDSGSLRFASPSETNLARQETQPVPRAGATQLAESASPQRRTATASGWIAGSAPVRSSTVAGSPRVRMPGEGLTREPVSLAAIDQMQGVPIAPLEPAPTGASPGEPSPLRVATPSSSTGWR